MKRRWWDWWVKRVKARTECAEMVVEENRIDYGEKYPRGQNKKNC